MIINVHCDELVTNLRHNMATENGDTTMRIDPQRAKLLVKDLEHVYQRIEKVQGNRKVSIKP